MIQTESPSADPIGVARVQCNYELIPDGSKHTGLLQRAISENENHRVIQVGRASFLVPRMVTTKGGLVDLAAWAGLEVEVSRYGERVFARLVAPDEQQMRIWELEELIARHTGAYPSDCVIPRQDALDALGYGQGRQETPGLYKYTAAKEKREKALAAVVG